MDKIAITKRADGAKWTSKVIGTQDFKEDHKLRQPGTFEKGKKPGDLLDQSDQPDKPTVD